MKSLRLQCINRMKFSPEQGTVLRLLGEHRGRQTLYARQRPETLEALRTVAAVESTDASNRLEGIEVPPGRLGALMRKSVAPRNRSEREVAGYRDALELIHQSRTDMPVSVPVILQLHGLVYRYLTEDGGRWKSVDNEIVERDAQGNITRVRFRAVPAVGTPQAMDDLLAGYQTLSQEGVEGLILVPLTILDFLCVHPFRDGNGRVARLLALLLLYHANYDVGRYISLERIHQETSRSYYDALEASSRGWHEGRHDAMPWVEYFWGVLLRAYREFEERVGSVDRGRGSKSEHVRAAIERKVIPFAISDLEKECPDVGRQTIGKVLREMRAAGKIELMGRGRGARWRRVGEGRGSPG